MFTFVKKKLERIINENLPCNPFFAKYHYRTRSFTPSEVNIFLQDLSPRDRSGQLDWLEGIVMLRLQSTCRSILLQMYLSIHDKLWRDATQLFSAPFDVCTSLAFPSGCLDYLFYLYLRGRTQEQIQTQPSRGGAVWKPISNFFNVGTNFFSVGTSMICTGLQIALSRSLAKKQ